MTLLGRQQRSALGHGIAGVDREVEDRVLELMGIGERRTESRCEVTTSLIPSPRVRSSRSFMPLMS